MSDEARQPLDLSHSNPVDLSSSRPSQPRWVERDRRLSQLLTDWTDEESELSTPWRCSDGDSLTLPHTDGVLSHSEPPSDFPRHSGEVSQSDDCVAPSLGDSEEFFVFPHSTSVYKFHTLWSFPVKCRNELDTSPSNTVHVHTLNDDSWMSGQPMLLESWSADQEAIELTDLSADISQIDQRDTELENENPLSQGQLFDDFAEPQTEIPSQTLVSDSESPDRDLVPNTEFSSDDLFIDLP